MKLNEVLKDQGLRRGQKWPRLFIIDEETELFTWGNVL